MSNHISGLELRHLFNADKLELHSTAQPRCLADGSALPDLFTVKTLRAVCRYRRCVIKIIRRDKREHSRRKMRTRSSARFSYLRLQVSRTRTSPAEPREGFRAVVGSLPSFGTG
jgi:hypothetical protein